MDLHPQLKLSFVFIFALTLLCEGRNSDLFVVHPSSVVAALGRSAEFYCSCRGHALVWYVDEEVVSRQHGAERGLIYQTTTRDGVFVSQLLVMATERNNNSKVECGVLVYGEGIRSLTAVFLTVQGYLAAPGHFEVIAHQKILQLKWTPPFSLEGVSIMGYLLNATVVTNIHVSSLESKHLNSTVTSYNFTTENPSPCHKYQFMIRAINEVGYGNWSGQINGSFQEVPAPVAVENVEVMIRLGGHVGVTFMFLGDDCPGRNVDDYIVHILTIQPQNYQCTQRNLTTASSVKEVVLTFTTTTDILPLNEHYWGVIEAQNEMGSRNGSGIYISTFDVQNISELTEEPPGNFCAQCVFVEGSKAEGCCIMLEEIEKESKAYRDATSPTCIQVVKGGNYTLLVYDIEENYNEVTSYSCYQNPKPAVTREIIIKGNAVDMDKEGEILAHVTMITVTVAGGVLLLLVPAVCIAVCNVVYQRQQKNKKQGLKQHHENPTSQLKDCPDQQIQTTPNPAYGELPITQQSTLDQDVHIYEDIPTFHT